MQFWIFIFAKIANCRFFLSSALNQRWSAPDKRNGDCVKWSPIFPTENNYCVPRSMHSHTCVPKHTKMRYRHNGHLSPKWSTNENKIAVQIPCQPPNDAPRNHTLQRSILRLNCFSFFIFLCLCFLRKIQITSPWPKTHWSNKSLKVE